MRWPVLLVMCGCDRALCTQDVGIQLEVAATVTADRDPAAPGIQTPVRAQTSFAPGDVVTLSVNGAATTATVDLAGVADFGLVTVPMPTATLRATASTVCGAADVTTRITVSAGASCELAFAAAGETLPRFAPLPVYNVGNDADPATPGEQQPFTATAFPGARVELRQRSALGEETMAAFTSTGSDRATITVREGGISLFASCTDGPIALTSPAISAYVDSVAPTCAIETPIVTDTALSVTGRTPDLDLEGEPATLTVGGVDAHATPVDGGQTHGSVPLPGAGTIALAMQDHAHNACASQR